MTAASSYVTDQYEAQRIKRQERDACMAEFVKLYREFGLDAPTPLLKIDAATDLAFDVGDDALEYWAWMRGVDDVAAIKAEARRLVTAEMANRQAALPL